MPPRTAARLTSVLLAASLLASCARGSTAPGAGAGTATTTPQIAGQPIASTAATARASLPVVEFERADGTLARLPVEVPPPTEYSIGLSGRRALPDERGMLFYYQQVARGAFSMKDTHFDLAIAFVAPDGKIVDIIEMRAESTSIVTPRADYQYAVEAPAGWYTQQGVRIGDYARLAFPLPAYLTSG